jgi:integrase
VTAAPVTLTAALPMRDGSITFARLVDLWMPQTSGRDTTLPARMSWWVQRFGALRLDELTDDLVHQALQDLAQRPPRQYAGKDADGRPVMKVRRGSGKLAGSTVNRYGAALSAVLSWAVKQRITPKGWVHPAHGLQRQREAPGVVRFLSVDERERLLAACKASRWPRLYLLVLAALTTGARRGELLGLRWRDVDLEAKVFHVERSKNGSAKVLPMVAAVVEEMRRFKGAPSALVFPSRVDPSRAMDPDQAWRTAMGHAKVKNFRFHDLRHTAASYLAQNGATLLELSDLLGHKSVTMSARYSHLCSGHRAALVERVMGGMR